MSINCPQCQVHEQIYDIWIADKNTRLYKNEMLRYHHLLKLLPGEINSIVDVGCGTGYMSYLCARRHFKLTSVDIAEKKLALFKDIATASQIKQVQSDLFDLNLNGYDAIISQEVLEHIPDYEAAIVKMRTFVKKDGYALFCVPYKENLTAKTKICSTCNQPYHTSGHLHQFTKENFTKIILKSGFQILKVKLIVNKRTVKWLATIKLPVNHFVLAFDHIMNFLFSYKSTYLAVLSKRID